MAQPQPYIIELSPGQRSAVILNHVGFDSNGPKHFVVPGPKDAGFTKFEVLDPAGVPVHTGTLEYAGATAEWSTAPSVWTGDFSSFSGSGVGFRIRLTSVAEAKTTAATTTTTTTTTRAVLGERFDIGAALVADAVVPDIVHYLRSQRTSGRFAKKDFRVRFAGGARADEAVDVHGGWFDASGDTSKYLSHLSYANFMNPQQTPLVAWALLDAASHLEARGLSDRLKSFVVPLRDEALYGCDFLVRMQDKEGYFYQTVFDKWSKDVEQREICEYSTQKGLKHSTWQAAYRQGAGLTIAALARASALPNDFIDSTADYTGPEYLAAAERGFKHLEEEGRNTSYLNDGIENIIDHYAALLAASELYAATQKEEYLTAARSRSASLIACQVSNDQFKNFWMSNGKAPSDPDARPFFHASDAGLPVIALARYAEIEVDLQLVAVAKATIRKSIDFEVLISKEVNNPFGYPRQYTKAVGGVAQSAFFFPHENESGYWWQGENARLGSLSSATAKAIQLLSSEIDADTLSQWKNFQVSAIDWVLGKNPYDMCMLQGRGRRNPEYLPQFPNAPGGVCNGITGGFENENDIAFKPDPHGADWAQNWRWGEQWIPHGAYLALATALLV